MSSSSFSANDTTPADSSTWPGPVVSVEWLVHHQASTDVVVLCASMGNPRSAQEKGIPGAFLADIEADFSAHDAEYPHTVPHDLQTLVASYGISDDTTVVVYDRRGLVVAPRVWWLLRAAGLDHVSILDGGLPAWINAGQDTAPLSLPQVTGTITAAPRPELIVGIEAVEQATARSNSAVVDARSAGRFAGVEPEPRPGLKSGHIPGSVNIPFDSVVNSDRTLKSPAELRALFDDVTDGASTMVFSCGSGVTACVDAYAATVAGFDSLAVFDGSWSQWGDPSLQKPIA